MDSSLIMDFLLTSSRLPCTIEQIRKLGRRGHRVYAVDSLRFAPGNGSRYATESFVISSPRYRTAQYLDELEAIVRERTIDRLLPSFEDVFYIARARARFDRWTHVFAPPLATLSKLHDKRAFIALAGELGLPVPQTHIARSRAELETIAREIGAFFARPAYTRGGVTLFTNRGPLAGRTKIHECEPTAQNPFVVQPFVEGVDVCTYSVAHAGRVVAHAAYVHPLRLEHAGGITFESIDAQQTLPYVQRIVEATGYDGQISFDFLATDRGLVMIECNPRPSAGLLVMPDEMLEQALVGRPDRVLLAPPGEKRKLSLALLRNAVLRSSERRESLRALFSPVRDVYADPDDPMPLLYQLLAYGRVMWYRLANGRVHRTDLMQGYLHDLCWNGEDQRTDESSRWTSAREISLSVER